MGVTRSSRALWSLGFPWQLPWISFSYPKTQLIAVLTLRLLIDSQNFHNCHCLSYLLVIHCLSERSLLWNQTYFYLTLKSCLTQSWGYVTKLHSFTPPKKNAPKSNLATFLQDFQHLFPDHSPLLPRLKYKVLQLCFFPSSTLPAHPVPSLFLPSNQSF